MDLLEFISRSEWPILTGVTLFFLRRPLKELLHRVSITKFDAWGIKAEFEKRLDQVEQVTGSPPDLQADFQNEKSSSHEKGEAVSGVHERSDTMSYLASDPRNRIIVAWRELDARLKERHASISSEPFIYVKSSEAMGYSQEQVKAILNLKHLARSVETGRSGPVDEAEALRFETAARRLLLPS